MRNNFLRLVPGLVVSVGFTIWFLTEAHWGELATALNGVGLGWVVLSASVLFTEFFIRAVRWKVLLMPQAPQARLSRLFVATVIGMSMNVVLPFRAGDFARPWLGSRETGLRILPLVTIAVIERVFDIIGLFSIFCLMLVLLPSDAQAEGELVHNLKVYGTAFGIAGGLGLLTFLLLAAYHEQTRGLVVRLSPLLGPLRGKVLNLYDGLAAGLECVRSPKALAMALGLSWIHWFNGSLSIYLLFKAFAVALPFAAACFTSVAIALGAAAPQAPGFVGVFHVTIQKTLVLWGLSSSPAQAFAIVFWGVSFLPIAVTGAILAWREGFSLSRLRREMAASSEEPTVILPGSVATGLPAEATPMGSAREL